MSEGSTFNERKNRFLFGRGNFKNKRGVIIDFQLFAKLYCDVKPPKSPKLSFTAVICTILS